MCVWKCIRYRRNDIQREENDSGGDTKIEKVSHVQNLKFAVIYHLHFIQNFAIAVHLRILCIPLHTQKYTHTATRLWNIVKQKNKD